jgi:hypothetical protein
MRYANKSEQYRSFIFHANQWLVRKAERQAAVVAG